MKRQILVATTNPGKIRELREILDLDVQWLGLSEVPPMPEVREDGATFAENARKKATTYARLSGLWTLSDDSGLVIDALQGEPGVFSARYSGATGVDRATLDRLNMEAVLKKLTGVPEDRRSARFVCHVCLASPQEVLLETHGVFEGRIIDTPKGSQGFGYDPIFWVPQLQKTVAQLNPAEKNARSHRGQAIARLKPLLQALLG